MLCVTRLHRISDASVISAISATVYMYSLDIAIDSAFHM